MTSDELQSLDKIVQEGRSILGRITVLREKIAWIDGGEILYLAFDRGASKATNVSTQRVPIVMNDPTQAMTRTLVRRGLQTELESLEAALSGLEK